MQAFCGLCVFETVSFFADHAIIIEDQLQQKRYWTVCVRFASVVLGFISTFFHFVYGTLGVR